MPAPDKLTDEEIDNCLRVYARGSTTMPIARALLELKALRRPAPVTDEGLRERAAEFVKLWFCPGRVKPAYAIEPLCDLLAAIRDAERERCVQYHIHGQRSCQGQADAATSETDRDRYLDRARMHQRYAASIREAKP